MSEHTGQNLLKASRLDRRFIRTLRLLLPLQKNNNGTADLLK
jgi:hypothetical protein